MYCQLRLLPPDQQHDLQRVLPVEFHRTVVQTEDLDLTVSSQRDQLPDRQLPLLARMVEFLRIAVPTEVPDQTASSQLDQRPQLDVPMEVSLLTAAPMEAPVQTA